MKKIIPLVLLLLLTLTACIGPGLSETEQKITGDYLLIKKGEDKSTLVRKVDSKDKDLKLFKPLVPYTVISTAKHKDYIFAKQQNYNFEEDKLDTSKVYYWIISTLPESVKGPLSLDEFTRTLNDFGIKSEVKWVNVN